MEIIFTVYWVIIGLLILAAFIGGLSEGEVGDGIAIGLMVLMMGCILRFGLDFFIPDMPITVSEITQDVEFINYGHNLGIEGRIISVGNPLTYERLTEEFKSGQIKFYKNYKPKNELSWIQLNRTTYRAFRNGEMVFESTFSDN